MKPMLQFFTGVEQVGGIKSKPKKNVKRVRDINTKVKSDLDVKEVVISPILSTQVG